MIILTIGYCASTTAISVCYDMKKGIIDRFRSIPISKSSVLTGHVLASVVRNYFATIMVIIVALIIGFRPAAGFLGWVAAAFIVLLYMLFITWISVFFGLIAKSPDSAGAFGFFILFLPYVAPALCQQKQCPLFYVFLLKINR